MEPSTECGVRCLQVQAINWGIRGSDLLQSLNLDRCSVLVWLLRPVAQVPRRECTHVCRIAISLHQRRGRS